MSIQSRACIWLLSIALPLPVVAAEPGRSAATSQPASTIVIDDDAQANAAAEAILERHLPELHFNATKFPDVSDFLRDVTGANLFVDWTALESAGISRDAPVTAKLRDVKFSTALDLVLQSVSVNVEVVYTIQSGVITLTTADRAAQRIVVKTYDVSALANTGPGVDALRLMIMNNIDAASWRSNGGSVGAISIFKDKLIVTHDALTQRKIDTLLRSLARNNSPPNEPNSAKPHAATSPAKGLH
jgi:hypothetical protein